MLHAEITQLGYRGSLRTVYRYLQPLRTGTAPAPLTTPKIGEVTSWLLRRTEDLNPRQQQLLTELRGHCAQPGRLAGHVTSFAKMMTKRTGQQDLPGWLERVEADDQPELHTFAAGIRQDLAAVTAGLTQPYSSGSTEGNVNRLILWNAPPSQSTESMFGENPRRWRPRLSCGHVSLGFHRTYIAIKRQMYGRASFDLLRKRVIHHPP